MAGGAGEWREGGGVAGGSGCRWSAWPSLRDLTGNTSLGTLHLLRIRRVPNAGRHDSLDRGLLLTCDIE